MSKVCFFTGHRTLPKEQLEEIARYLRCEILDRINEGYDTFITGGALGFDTMAAEEVIKLREDYSKIKLNLYLPCTDQEAKWQEADQLRYHSIMRQADDVYYVSEKTHFDGCMRLRNQKMVDDSQMGIAYSSKRRSGTYQTVEMALKQQKRIVNIYEILKQIRTAK